MAVNCKLTRGVFIDCNRPEGPGGIAKMLLLDKSELNEGSFVEDIEGYITTFSTYIPLTQKFYNVKFEDDNRTYVNDPSTDKTAGAFYLDITAQTAIDDNPLNRKFVNQLEKTRVTMLYQTNKGQWRIVGTFGKGLIMNQRVESNSGAAPGDQNRILLNFKGQENTNKGARFLWLDVVPFDLLTVYAVGEYTKELDVLSGEYIYYISNVAANTGNLPSTSPTEWTVTTEAEVRDSLTNTFVASITNV